MLFVVLGAMYAIAAATESANQTMGQLIRAREDVETLNRQLALLARTDELTGLSNRRALSENLELLWAWCVRESKPVAMLMVDIDCFHQYNETYGHLHGDAVIRQLGSVIGNSARRTTEQVRALGIEHTGSSVEPMVTVSIGVLAAEQAIPGSAMRAVARCDALLYRAKASGRNRTVTERLDLSESSKRADLP